ERLARRRLGCVDRNHQPLASRLDVLDEDSTLCLLGPARYPSPQEWQALLKWVGGGGKLLVAARWNDAELTIPGINAGVKSTRSERLARRRLGCVDRNHQPLASRLDVLDEDSTLCLLGPARYPSPQEWQALLKWVGGGGKLLVAARWNDAELTIPGINAGVKST